MSTLGRAVPPPAKKGPVDFLPPGGGGGGLMRGITHNLPAAGRAESRLGQGLLRESGPLGKGFCSLCTPPPIPPQTLSLSAPPPPGPKSPPKNREFF